jgi:hypothetical protein
VRSLATDLTGPWADYKHGKPIGQAQLARLLKPFGLIPGSVRIGTATPKGYERKSFEEAWSRYLPAPGDAPSARDGGIEPQHRHNPQEAKTFAPCRPATATCHVAERNAGKPAAAATCGGVAAEIPPSWNSAATVTEPALQGESEGVL